MIEVRLPYASNEWIASIVPLANKNWMIVSTCNKVNIIKRPNAPVVFKTQGGHLLKIWNLDEKEFGVIIPAGVVNES